MNLPNNGGGDDPGYPFNNNNNNKHFGKDDPSKRSSSSRSKDHDYHSLMQTYSEDTTTAETSVGSDSIMSGITNPSSVQVPPAAVAVTASAAAARAGPAPPAAQGGGGALQNANATTHSQLTTTATTTTVTTTTTTTVDQQRRRLLRQLQGLGIVTGSTFVLAIVSLVPTPFLMAILVCTLALLSLIHKLYQAFLFELNLLMQGRGIGDYLPASIYEQLTTTSLHEFMSDRSVVNENAYMMLYLIPGLSREQIDAYVGRLAPRHQQILHRSGIGYFLGPDFMRLIMGDERLPQTTLSNGQRRSLSISAVSAQDEAGGDDGDAATTASPVVPRRLVLPPTIPEEGGDDTSVLGEEDDPTVPLAAAPASPQGGTPQSSLEAPQTEEAIRAESEAEEQVIYDAIGSAVATYMGVAADMVQSSARRSASVFSGTVFRASMSLTMLGFGISIYGFWTGAYRPETFFQPTMRMLQDQTSAFLRPPQSLRPQLPSSNALVTSTLLSGATAGIMLIFQLASGRPQQEQGNDKGGECQDAGNEQDDGCANH